MKESKCISGRNIMFLSFFSDAGDYRIVGCPKTIEDNKYARNALIFNVVFVFAAQADTSPYEAVVQKLGEAFKTYEVRSDF